jgi:hypothetical protein
MIHYGKEPQTDDLNIIVPPDEVKEIYELINSTTLLQRRTFYGLKAYIEDNYKDELTKKRKP